MSLDIDKSIFDGKIKPYVPIWNRKEGKIHNTFQRFIDVRFCYGDDGLSGTKKVAVYKDKNGNEKQADAFFKYDITPMSKEWEEMRNIKKEVEQKLGMSCYCVMMHEDPYVSIVSISKEINLESDDASGIHFVIISGMFLDEAIDIIGRPCDSLKKAWESSLIGLERSHTKDFKKTAMGMRN